MSAAEKQLNALVVFQNLSNKIVDAVSEPVDCGHVGGSYQGDQHKKLFFSASTSALAAAFDTASCLGLRVTEIPAAELAQEWSGEFADKGYRIFKPASAAR